MRDFEALFGHRPHVTASAPGRVNLMGEHTDYNGGFVLPTVIPQRTRAEVMPRTDLLVRAASANTEDASHVQTYRIGDEQRGRGWLDYVQGLTAVLAREGHAIAGFDLWIDSQVPPGGGLSSSAALEVSVLRALREAFGLALDDAALAGIAHRAEHDFVGARVGIMDQMAVSLGTAGRALFLDTRSITHESVALPEALEIVVLDSGFRHDHATGSYNLRRAECEEACHLLGVRALRDLGSADLGRVAALPAHLHRRVRHVLTENERVHETVSALEREDLDALRPLLGASHRSQRDDYEVSLPAIDRLVAIVEQDADAFGARLTGGGFGGAVLVLARRGRAAGVAARAADRSTQAGDPRPRVVVPPGSGREA